MGINISPRDAVSQNALRLNKGFRTLTSPIRLLPDFIIIGGQRCGTTSLYRYLTEHPEIAPARRKEVHFFDNNFHRGANWYRSHFPLSIIRLTRKLQERKFIAGEASPYYLFHPHAAQRIRQLVPDAKLIVLLRNPVDRAYSHYHLSVRLGFETLSFEQAIDAEQQRLGGILERMVNDGSYRSFSHQHHSYLARGIYVDQLKCWFNIFPRNQLLIINSEEFYAEPASILYEVTNHLGVTPHHAQQYRVHNDGRYSSLEQSTREFLYDYYASHNQRLYHLLGVDYGWDCQR